MATNLTLNPWNLLNMQGRWIISFSRCHRTPQTNFSYYNEVFKPLKSFFNNACQKWMRSHPGRRIQKENLGQLFKDAYIKSTELENAVLSFCISGIIPFNPDIMPEHEYIKDPRPTTSQCHYRSTHIRL